MINKLSALVALIFLVIIAQAQPANDACTGATLIPNVVNYCSANAAGTTVAATDDIATGSYAAAGCWTGAINDVWYKFVAVATDITIVINGNQGSPAGGTLARPQVALYSGACGGTINELVCGAAPAGQNIIQVYKGGLTIGETYLIRVDGVNANKGTFQYCVNNYMPIPNPSSDCNSPNNQTPVLCSNSAFSVQSINSAGSNATEMNSASCFGYDPIWNPANVESNSTWYKFTVGNSGTFNFVINPNNPNDDIDFVVYKLPNGVSNCTGKQVVRCMASSCSGSTGLRPTSVDVSEPSGCATGQDNYLSNLNVVTGESYAIAINNFTSTGNGFSISFGGSSTIQGPTALINDNDADDIICPGEAITFSDASTSAPGGTLVKWTWNFGTGSNPTTFVGQNPPSVNYSTIGTKTITLTIESDKGCLVTITKNITVANTPPTVSISASSTNIYPGTNVTFTATPSNAGTNPTYQWYLNGSPVGTNSSTYSNNSLTNNAQVYVKVTSNASCNNGVSANSNTVTISHIAASPVSVSITGTASACAGSSISLTANPTNGGTNPIYQWYVNGNPVGTNSSTYSSTSFNNGDVVTVKLTSDLSCTSGNPATSAAVNITIKPIPVVSVNSPSICNGQSVTLTASGATSYAWNNGATSASISVSPTITTTYTVTGTTNGCNGTATSTVTVKSTPVVSVNSPSICNGQSVTLTASGATTYAWNTGATSASISVSPTTTTTYTVTGTTNGCNGTATSTVTVKPLPIVSVNSPSICNGQSATLTASGATTYSWNTGATSASILVSPTTTTTYTVTGTTNGCDATVTSTVTVKPLPVVTVNSTSICNGQSATLTASGATTYSWNTGATSASISVSPTTTTTYTVTGITNGCNGTATSTITVKPTPVVSVNSPSLCNGQSATLTASGATTYAWNTGSTSASISVSPTTTTTYTVTGTTNGCDATITSLVTVKPIPVVSVNSPSICNGQSATLTASGATTYSWNTGATSASILVSPTTTTTYTVTGTTNGCNGTATSTVTVKPTPIINVNSPSICNGQSATLTASGATTYAWNTGATSASISVSPTATTTYTVTGTTNGCNGTATSTVTVKPIPVVTVNSENICPGQSATLTANGATSFSWNTGATTSSISVTPSSSTTYTVTGTTNGCSATATSNVNIAPNLPITVNNSSICAGQNAVLTASGATNYTWSNGATGASISVNPSSTSTYSVLGSTNGCNGTATATVTVKTNPIVSVNSPSICNGQSVTLTASGATTYAWNTGATSASISVSPTTTTTYTVIGTTNGCDGTTTSTVTVKPNPIVTVNSPSICNGQSVTLTASGATSYSWNVGSTNASITFTPNSTSTYTVTGTTNGCSSSAISTVTIKPNPTVSVNSPSICNGQNATLTASGATTYAWNTGATSASISVSPTLTTTYTVTGTTNGCVGTATSTVTLKPNPTVGVNSPSICNGQSATLTAIGATTYTWSNGATGTSISVNPSSTTNYTVTGTNNGCTGTAIAQVTIQPTKVTNLVKSICSDDSFQVGNQYFHSTGNYVVHLNTTYGCDSTVNLNLSVVPSLTPSLTITANKNDVCPGDQIVFTSSVNDTRSNISYQWFLNNNPIGTNSSQYSSSQLQNGDVIKLIVHSPGNCMRVDSAVSNSITISSSSIQYTIPYIEFCPDDKDTIDLSIIYSNSNHPNYTVVWTNGTTNDTIQNSDSYPVNNSIASPVRFSILYGNQCKVSNNVPIHVLPRPAIQATAQPQVTTYNTSAQLNVSGNNLTTFNWQPSAQVSNAQIQNPTSTITQSTWFYVKVTDNKGCINTDSVFVEMINQCHEENLYIPTAFSPNNDGINDCFGLLQPPVLRDFHMLVFNRWGEKVFESKAVNICWDGSYKSSIVENDTYIYIVNYICYDGTPISKKGSVTVLR